jgi:hypothetical protein
MNFEEHQTHPKHQFGIMNTGTHEADVNRL